jgi:hypothetical protein
MDLFMYFFFMGQSGLLHLKGLGLPLKSIPPHTPTKQTPRWKTGPFYDPA